MHLDDALKEIDHTPHNNIIIWVGMGRVEFMVSQLRKLYTYGNQKEDELMFDTDKILELIALSITIESMRQFQNT